MPLADLLLLIQLLEQYATVTGLTTSEDDFEPDDAGILLSQLRREVLQQELGVS